MKNKRFNKILVVFFFGLLLTLTSCSKNKIATPNGLNIDDNNNLIWNAVDEAKTYNISLYNVDNGTTTLATSRKASYNLDKLTEGDYEISVQSVSGEKKKKDSNYSDILLYHKYFETGCVYNLINNNTEYQVTKYGKASGEIVIEDYYRNKAVTKIADACFKGSTRVTSVIIGNNVITVGNNAFYNCSNLKSVTIPQSVRSLGNACFQSCRSLESITIPSSITELGDYTFAYCRSLVEAKIPETLEKIGVSCFQDCSALTSIVIPNKIKLLPELCFGACKALEEVVIGNGVEEIGKDCFYRCSVLNNIVFGNKKKLSIIGEECFAECLKLNNVVLPNGLKTISKRAFQGCSELMEISIPDSVSKIGAFAFLHSALFTSQVANGSFVYADNWLVYCTPETIAVLDKIDTNTLKDTIVGIADQVFAQCPNLETVILPASFKYIGESAFYGCPKLYKFRTLDDSIEVIGDYSFFNCVLTQLILGRGLKEIGSYAFYGNKQLENPNIGTTSWIPESVTRIGTYAFFDTFLWNHPRDDDGIIYASNWVVGYSSDLGSVKLNLDSKKVAGIADYAFYQSSLNSITGLAQCRYVGEGAFYQCKNLASVSFNMSVTEIRDFTFYECKSLLKVTYPVALESIGKYAFYKTGLADVDLEITDCETIGKSAFYLNENLKSVKLSECLKTIDDYAFYRCSLLKDITFTDDVESIGLNCFYRCEALESITFNNKITVIPQYAFCSCTALKEIIIPDNVVTIEKNAFYKCTNVENVQLGSHLVFIGDYAFYGMEKANKLDIPNSLLNIGNYAFKGWLGLTSIVLPKTVRVLGQHVFYGCKNLTIYTDAESILGEWHERFNSSRRPIIWGVELDNDQTVLSFTLSSNTISNVNEKTLPSAPLCSSKTFVHWLDEDGASYGMEDLYKINKECKLTAVYE